MSFIDGIFYLDLLGTLVFAITGLLAAVRKQLDLFGALVLATVTAVGGGTIRDLILDTPVFWTQQVIYLYVILFASVFTYIYIRFFNFPNKLLLWLDALGLAVFTVIGAQKALDFGLAMPVVVLMGVMTGVLGGIIRDVLAGEVPLIFRKEIYATASVLGAIVYILALEWFAVMEWAAIVAIALVFVLRVWAIHAQASLPTFGNPNQSGQ
jgi:uncharacterized membrane protein YeiH